MSGVIPSVSPQDLEKILSVLPNPNQCIFKVYDPSMKADYSGLYKRLHENLPATKRIHFFADANLTTNYLQKEILQSLYTSFYQAMETLQTGKNWDSEKVGLNLVEANWSYCGKVPPDFEKQWLASGGEWNMDISITPHHLKITYEKDIPVLARKIEQLLVSSTIKLKLEQLPQE